MYEGSTCTGQRLLRRAAGNALKELMATMPQHSQAQPASALLLVTSSSVPRAPATGLSRWLCPDAPDEAPEPLLAALFQVVPPLADLSLPTRWAMPLRKVRLAGHEASHGARILQIARDASDFASRQVRIQAELAGHLLLPVCYVLPSC